MSKDRKVSWVATRLHGFALIWWSKFLQQRLRQNLGQVTTWEHMKEALVTKFVPMNYAQQLYGKLQNLKQDPKIMQEYTESFYRLQSRCNLPERVKKSAFVVICMVLGEIFGPKRIVKCYSCGKKGHVQANCPKKSVLTIAMESPQLETNDEAYIDTYEGILTPTDTGFPMLLAHVSPIHESARGNVFRQNATLYNPLASKTCPAHVVLASKTSKKVHPFKVGDFEELAEIVRVGVRMGDFSDYVLCHVYGTRDANRANRNLLHANGFSVSEDLHFPIHLQLSQPEHQNYESPTRAAKLGRLQLQ
ncbi:hypothetical protein IFM89_036659 [Coptis chinensis]|uniref:CCHC-type domain-containing protein n=1 Tax=Coptis chinensis TaxID=261450 RepID=A0A835M5X0_9MAGN|nr:hypothetical protein IFM89_036659 [Coptis chinensis]